MYSDTNTTRSVADAVMKVMNEKLHPNQQKLDVHEPEKDELTAKDFEMLRAKKAVKKEEVELEEDVSKMSTDKLKQHWDKHKDQTGASPVFAAQLKKVGKELAKRKALRNEEVETVEEGLKDIAKKAFKAVTGGSDEDQRKDLQRKMGVPQTGKKPVKEDIEQIDELKRSTLGSYVKKASRDNSNRSFDHGDDEHRQYGMGDDEHEDARVDREEKKIETRQKGIDRAATRLAKEEIDQAATTILEYETDKNGKFVHNAKSGRYGGSEKPTDPFAGVRGPGQKDLAKIEAEKKKKKFSEMVNLYQEKGLKALSEMLVKEEPDNEQFTKELEDAKAKSEGKKPNKEIAKGKVDAVQSEEVQTEDEVIEERHMSDAEMNKREDIVKSMKKGMQGFKDRYGDRAKDVMYATATKQAMK